MLSAGCTAKNGPRGPIDVASHRPNDAQTLIILAGGGSEGEPGDADAWSARLYRHFLDGGDITGDGRITIAILAAREHTEWLPRYLESLGADRAFNLTLDSTAAADDPALDERFAHVDAVFIKGGDQGRYYDLWNDRRIEHLIRSVAQRGGAVGGTSAGAMAMAEFALTGSKSLASQHVLEDSHTPFLDDESDGGSGIHRDFLSFVPGVMIDSHVTQRNRLGRMLGACAKAVGDFQLARAESTGVRAEDPVIRAIGLDEQTGLVIKGPIADCVGNGTVSIVTATRKSRFRRDPGRPLTWTNLRFDQLTDGGRIDLTSGQCDRPSTGFQPRPSAATRPSRIPQAPEYQTD